MSPVFYTQFVKTVKPNQSSNQNLEKYGYRLSFAEEAIRHAYTLNSFFFEYGTDLTGPPTILSLILDYLNHCNKKVDEDFKQQHQNYIIASSSGNYKKEDLKKLKPDSPNYYGFEVEKWHKFLDDFEYSWIFDL